MEITNDTTVDRETPEIAQQATWLPAFLCVPLDPATMTVPRGSLSRHLALSAKLQAQRPDVLSPEQARRPLTAALPYRAPPALAHSDGIDPGIGPGPATRGASDPATAWPRAWPARCIIDARPSSDELTPRRNT